MMIILIMEARRLSFLKSFCVVHVVIVNSTFVESDSEHDNIDCPCRHRGHGYPSAYAHSNRVMGQKRTPPGLHRHSALGHVYRRDALEPEQASCVRISPLA